MVAKSTPPAPPSQWQKALGLEELTTSAPNSAGLADTIYHELDPDIDTNTWVNWLEEAYQALAPGGWLILDTGKLATSDGQLYRDRLAKWSGLFNQLDRQGFSFYRHNTPFLSFRKERQNVLYLAPWVTWGGADKGTLDWFRYLDKNRYRLFLITTQVSENAWINEIEPQAEEVWTLPDLMRGQEMPQFILEFIATRNIQLVHIMNSRLAYDLLPQIKQLYPHLRTVVQHHAEEEDKSGYCRYTASRYSNLIDTYSVTSQNLKRIMEEYNVPPAKLEVIYTGVDTQREFNPDTTVTPTDFRQANGLDRPGFHIFFPARLDDQKNPLLAVEIAARLRELGSQAVIHSVGDGVLRREVEAAIVQAGLQDRFILHGPSRQMAAWYKNTAVTFLPSRFEGIPYVVFEAMAMGQPVVVSDVGANRELVDTDTSFLISPHTNREAYVEALLQLERDEGLRQRLGEAARRKMSTGFSLELMAEGHHALYQRLNGEHLARLSLAQNGKAVGRDA